MDVPNQKSVLRISYLGYQTQDAVVGNKTNFNIDLVVAASQLNEVIVVGYGTQKKATLTGSVSTIKGTDIVKSPATNRLTTVPPDVWMAFGGLAPSTSCLLYTSDAADE